MLRSNHHVFTWIPGRHPYLTQLHKFTSCLLEELEYLSVDNWCLPSEWVDWNTALAKTENNILTGCMFIWMLISCYHTSTSLLFTHAWHLYVSGMSRSVDSWPPSVKSWKPGGSERHWSVPVWHRNCLRCPR